MRILALQSNKKSFHPIRFNPTGVSLIIGVMSPENRNNRSKTYNSVGKSLIVRIIHFCLGSNPYKDFQRELPDWEFTLTVEIQGATYELKRATNHQNVLYIDGKKYSKEKFRETLRRLVFNITENIPFLKFRSLISRFIRPRKSSYVSYKNFIAKEIPYSEQLINAHLLGLEKERVIKKYKLRKAYEEAKTLKKNINKDPILRDFFQADKDVSLNISDLEIRIGRLEGKISRFEIAKDYTQIKKAADELTRTIRNHRNKTTALRNAIENINKSISASPDISKERVLRLYEEAEQVFSASVQKRLDDVVTFNNKILKDRLERLKEEQTILQEELNELTQKIEALGAERDQKLQYLKGKGALDEYTALTRQLSDFKMELDKLQKYEKLIDNYKIKLETISIDLKRENISTRKYIKEIDDLIKSNILLFREFTDAFYEDKVAGIEITPNEGDNQTRFNIDAKIQDDTGDGVNNVKIFCFDWTLLRGQHNHNAQFIYHDSFILDGLDPRQGATMLELAYENSLKHGFQYILNVNQDKLEAIEAYLGENYKHLVQTCKVLELTDKSEETKLLGIQVDLDNVE